MDFQLIIDTALLILIWLVQLIIYPVFGFMNAAELKRWHRVYVPRITLVVAPLMILQLVLYIYSFRLEMQSIIQVILLFGVWINTFLQAVPLHARIFIEKNGEIQFAVKKLLRVNWIRTVLWSVLWILHFFSL